MKLYCHKLPVLAALLAFPWIGSLAGEPREVTDQIAYSHLFMTLAPPPSAVGSPVDEKLDAERRESYAKHIGLSREQGSVLVAVAMEYRDYLVNLNVRATETAGAPNASRPLTSRERSSLEHLLSEKASAVTALIIKLHHQLGDQGTQIVRTYVDERVKPKVKFE